jgi:hypothetical protein
MGSAKCRDTKEKKSKMGKSMKEGSLMSFFKQGQKPTTNQATVMSMPVFQSTAAIQAGQDEPIQHFDVPATSPSWRAAEGLRTRTMSASLLGQLERAISCIPNTIPEATDGDPLASFPLDPASIAAPDLHGDELWEEVLNGFLKSVLGWGSDERALSAKIRRGEKGVAGILRFVKYFVEVRGVDERLFEGKLSALLEAMEKL